MRTTKRTKRDERGQVAVLRATPEGPRVTFINRAFGGTYNDAVIAALTDACGIYANHDGEGSYGYPRAVWVQRKPGQWVAA